MRWRKRLKSKRRKERERIIYVYYVQKIVELNTVSGITFYEMFGLLSNQ